MLYAIICQDKKDALQVRLDNRPAHVDYLKANIDNIHTAGPLLDDDEETMIGSLIIVNYDDRAGAEGFAAGDPYGKAGLFESVTIMPWKKVLPAD